MRTPLRSRVSVVVLAALAVGACGGSDVSAEQARRIVVNGLIDAGQPGDVAECVADEALARHEPGELANSAGTTSAEVNASIAAILAECYAERTPPTTPPPETTAAPTPTIPATTMPATTIPEQFDQAFCDASHNVQIVLAAAGLMNDPGPRAFEAWLDETLDRTELAVLTAPDGRNQDIHLTLRTEIEDLHELAESVDYDVDAPGAPAAEAEAIGARIQAQRELLEDVLETGCGVDLSDTDEAQRQAAELIALDVPTTTVPGSTPGSAPPTSVPVGEIEVDHAETGILLVVPGHWTAESAGVADTPFGPATRFLLRGPDVSVFTNGSLDGEGVGIYAVDGTVDYNSLLAAAAPVQACTLDRDEPYDDGVYVGTLRYYRDCGGSAASVVVVGAADDDAEVAVYVEIRVAGDDDPAIDQVLRTFYV
jgi:hypothetical protein